MAEIKIPTPLRPYTADKSIVEVQGNTVRDAVEDLMAKYPDLEPHLIDREQQLRPFINLFIAENNIKDLQNLDTPLEPGDKLILVPSIAGGSPSR